MIQIPDRLAELLRRDRTLDAAVKASLDELEPWLEAGGKRPTFFPDYTDHSVQHIQEVLETAVSLIRDEAWPALTPGDAAVLVLSTLLHDSAMHLTREGFLALVRPGTRWTPIDGFGDRPWPQLWADFCLEARRFDQRRLMDLFGDAEPVQIPDLDHLKLDDQARRLIGEFVRRHHPRLAHETARHGAPGHADEPLRIHGNGEIVDLAGLIARSHGLSARACLPYLKEHFGTRTDPLDVHAVFLIALLRVADYLQIQAGRAPERTLKVHKIRSPYSAVEWKLHASVRDIRRHEEDTEAVYVRAKPEDVETYLRLKGWLSGLQGEIDASWAVLGEVYSRQGERMDRLGMKVRRVFSNLDDEAEFAKTVAYLPRRLAFSTADADLLKLLIHPLYGERPEIGARELIQNAVDAVRELDSLREQGLVSSRLELAEQDADVMVSVEFREGDRSWWFTVRDRGIGMTPDVISNYFLRAGASFRNSDRWREDFLDEQGHSRVLRSGRFGIGGLAAFLLGDEIEVETRHASAPREEGLRFTASIHSSSIEVLRFARPAGTTVRVRLRNELVTPLAMPRDGRNTSIDWDWYCLAPSRVIRSVPKAPALPQRYANPDEGHALVPMWRHFKTPGYSEIHWTYHEAPALACNGIIVMRQMREKKNMFYEYAGLPLHIPNVSVFDRDGMLPINLARDGLATERLPFERALLSDVLRDYLAAALLTAPTDGLADLASSSWYEGTFYLGVASYGDLPGKWGHTANALLPIQAWNLWAADVRRIVVYPADRNVPELHDVAEERPASLLSTGGRPGTAYVPPGVLYSLTDRSPWAGVKDNFGRFAERWSQNAIEPTAGPSSLNEMLAAYSLKSLNLYVPRIMWQEYHERLANTPRFRLTEVGDTIVLRGIGHNNEEIPIDPEFTSNLPGPLIELAVQRIRNLPAKENEFVDTWRRLLPSFGIPMEPVERCELIESCRELHPYLTANLRDGVKPRHPRIVPLALNGDGAAGS
jgi:molecular chaperone HtpG